MPRNDRCAVCTGTNLHPGQIQSTGKTYFRPSDAKFLTLKTADIAVHATVCLDCGAIQLSSDPDRVRELLRSD
jgi:hypothetical protein